MPHHPDPITLFQYFLKSQKQAQKGFTLIELLVSIIVGSLIITTLLFLVIELLKVGKREEVLTQTQQDMRRAVDFIAADVGEADYVYASPAEVTRIANEVNGDPAWPDPVGGVAPVPVLAFWRLDDIDTSVIPEPATYDANDPDGCIAEFDGDKEGECSALKIRQSAYSLIVYLQAPNPNAGIWEGQSRLVRYELPKYSNVANLTVNAGYDDPSIDDPNVANDQPFPDWIKGAGTPAGNANTLVDYVTTIDANARACPDPVAYTRIPAASDSFYVCARTGDDLDIANGNNRVGGSSQSLIVYLTGNIEENPAASAASGSSRLPTLQREVLVRGVIEKRVE